MAGPPEPEAGTAAETFNPWSVVNLVFHHLADEGLHPTLGEAGDPGVPAAARRLGAMRLFGLCGRRAGTARPRPESPGGGR